MPKATFFNLSKDKRENLIDAAKKEFSRAPLSEALISNIVKTAGIARGSFYQYFDNKEDVYFFLLDEHSKENKANFVSSLKKTNGDLFESMIEMYHFMLKSFNNKENKEFFKNTFLNMNHKVENTFTESFNEEQFHQDLLDIKQLVKKDSLNVADEKEFIHAMKILMSVTFHNLIQNFVSEVPIDEAMENYRSQIELLKKGLASIE